MTERLLAIGVDVGGSGVKAAVVDTDTGELVSERLRIPTPNPSTPDKVSAAIGRLVRRLAKATYLASDVSVGVGLPGVTMGGRLVTAANIDPAWIDYPIADKLSKALKRPVSIVNDADAAGIAEMRFGVGAAKRCVVIFLTLGTGVGSGVFVDGTLVPNTEFGQMEIRGRPAERRSAAASRVRSTRSGAVPRRVLAPVWAMQRRPSPVAWCSERTRTYRSGCPMTSSAPGLPIYWPSPART